MSAKLLVDVDRLGGDIGKRPVELRRVIGRRISETGRRLDGCVPVRRPHPIGRTGSGRPTQHRRIERDAQPAADLDLVAERLTEEVERIDDELTVFEQLDLLRDADVIESDVGAHLRIARQHAPRIAQEQTITELPQPLPIDMWEQVVRHVLLIADLVVVGAARQVAIAVSKSLGPAAMISARAGWSSPVDARYAA